MSLKVVKTGLTDINQIREILKKEGYVDIYTWCDSPGTFYNWHTHSYDEVRWVYEGSIVIGHEDGEVELKPGDRMEVPAGTKHWAKTEEGVCYICASRL